jgi:hypothetical protein
MISRYASLRQGLVGAWCPSLGASGFSLIDRGYGNHGTLTNMDPGTDWVASGGKLALDFDGTNDFVVATIPLFSGSLSFSVWAKGVPGNANTNYMASIPVASSGSNGVDFKNPTNAQANLSLDGNFVTINSGVDIRDSWSHLLLGYGNGVAFFYVNGILVGSQAWGNGVSSLSSRQLNLGRFGTFGSHSPVQLDDIRLYNRALSPTEIQQLYTGGRGVGLIPERIKHRRKTTAAAFNRRRRILIGASQ